MKLSRFFQNPSTPVVELNSTISERYAVLFLLVLFSTFNYLKLRHAGIEESRFFKLSSLTCFLFTFYIFVLIFTILQKVNSPLSFSSSIGELFLINSGDSHKEISNKSLIPSSNGYIHHAIVDHGRRVI